VTNLLSVFAKTGSFILREMVNSLPQFSYISGAKNTIMGM